MSEVIERCAAYARQHATEFNLEHALTLAFAEFARAAQEPEVVEKVFRGTAAIFPGYALTLPVTKAIIAALFRVTGVGDAT
jgi:anti-sigma factor RsiW